MFRNLREMAACRCTKHRQLIAELDQGSAPPLSDRDAPPGKLWGPLHGTELLDPADLHRIKATEVRHVLGPFLHWLLSWQLL